MKNHALSDGIRRGIQAVRAETVSLADLVRNVEAVNRAFEEFKATNDQKLAALAKSGSVDALVTEKLDRINADITKHQAAIDETTKILARIRAGGAGGNELSPEASAYRGNFNAYFRRGENEGEVKQFNAAATRGSNPDGGYLVPDQMESTIDRVLGTVSAVRSIARVISISGASYSKLVNQGGATSGWVGENDARGSTSTPTLSKLEFQAMEIYANPYASQTLLDDASVDIGAWLADEVAIEFAEEEGAAFVTGNGVAKPRGLLSYDFVANASWSWGKVGYVASGKSATLDTDTGKNGAEKLISLIHALKQGYRQNARFMMNTTTLETLRSLKDANAQYVWQPSIKEGVPATLFGYQVTDDDNMPNIGADQYPILFGDFQRAYLIVDRQGIRVLRDPYSNKPYVSFYTTKRVGGGIQNFQAIKALKIATS
jgi:HK97 family phage major capsid protein